jgi:hypothetical protein
MTIASFRLASFGWAFVALLAVLAPNMASAQRYDRRMEIVNDTGRTLRELYATNTGTKNWGRDHLGQGVIPQGGRYVIDFNDGTGYCVFDFRAVLDNGIPIERYRINVCTDSVLIVR